MPIKREKIPLICKMCGKEFKVVFSRFELGEVKYCSKNCNTEAQKAPWWTNPEYKQDATNILNLAVCQGKIMKQPCATCRCGNVEAHHQDYTKPLEVMWFCRRHHQLWHQMLNEGTWQWKKESL